MSWTLLYVSGHLQQVSRCLQQNPGGIIGCREPHGMSLDVSSRSPRVSSGIQEVSLDVVNVNICLAKAPASLQVSRADIIGCQEQRGMALDVSSRSPGVSSIIQEGLLDVVNVDICLVKAPVQLQVSPVEPRRYHWMSQSSWYVSGRLQQVSRCLQQNPGGIIGCSEHRHMSCEGSSKSPGVSSGIQAVSFDVANLVLGPWVSPAGLQVSPAESRRYHWM